MQLQRCCGITKSLKRCNKKANRGLSKWYCSLHTPENQCIICNGDNPEIKLKALLAFKNCNHSIHLSCYREYLTDNDFPNKCPSCHKVIIMPNEIAIDWQADLGITCNNFIRSCLNLLKISERDIYSSVLKQIEISYTMYDFICANPTFLKENPTFNSVAKNKLEEIRLVEGFCQNKADKYKEFLDNIN